MTQKKGLLVSNSVNTHKLEILFQNCRTIKKREFTAVESENLNQRFDFVVFTEDESGDFQRSIDDIIESEAFKRFDGKPKVLIYYSQNPDFGQGLRLRSLPYNTILLRLNGVRVLDAFSETVEESPRKSVTEIVQSVRRNFNDEDDNLGYWTSMGMQFKFNQRNIRYGL